MGLKMYPKVHKYLNFPEGLAGTPRRPPLQGLPFATHPHSYHPGKEGYKILGGIGSIVSLIPVNNDNNNNDINDKESRLFTKI